MQEINKLMTVPSAKHDTSAPEFTTHFEVWTERLFQRSSRPLLTQQPTLGATRAVDHHFQGECLLMWTRTNLLLREWAARGLCGKASAALTN